MRIKTFIVILEQEQKYKALPARNVIGRQEIVVKPVGEEFSGLKFISGMSILGDGKVSLILDIDYLFEAEGAADGSARWKTFDIFLGQ
ncbi:MAG: chemotaxis protein CheW [Desulfosudis oleivorans]|nr:chemotaxis protein CheW [Desulfosudis oleivorans]